MTITNLLLLHKHLLRNILSNYWLMWNASYVQKHFSKPDRSHWMIRSENLCEGYHTTRSDAAHSFSKDSGSSDCENRTKRNWTTNWSTCRFLAWPVAISEHWHRKKWSRYVAVISRDIRMYCGRFVGPSLTVHGWSPCCKCESGKLSWREKPEKPKA